MIIPCGFCSKKIDIPKCRLIRSKKVYCSKKCAGNGLRGTVRSDEFKQKVSKGMIGVNTWTAGVKRPDRSGEKSMFWKGGVSEKNRTERQNFCARLEYKTLRLFILKRDNYTCQICKNRTSIGNRIILQVDHIKPYSLYPELRMEESNMRTVCKPCHHKTDTFGAKVYKLK